MRPAGTALESREMTFEQRGRAMILERKYHSGQHPMIVGATAVDITTLEDAWVQWDQGPHCRNKQQQNVCKGSEARGCGS